MDARLTALVPSQLSGTPKFDFQTACSVENFVILCRSTGEGEVAVQKQDILNKCQVKSFWSATHFVCYSILLLSFSVFI